MITKLCLSSELKHIELLNDINEINCFVEYKVIGKYLPMTWDEPAEFPEIEIISIAINNADLGQSWLAPLRYSYEVIADMLMQNSNYFEHLLLEDYLEQQEVNKLEYKILEKYND